MQQAGVAAQTILDKKDIATGVSLMFFARSLGGAIFVSVGQNIFTNRLTEGLAKVSSIDAEFILRIGATELRSLVAQESLAVVLEAYNNALTRTFVVTVAVSAAAIVGALLMEWKSVKKYGSGGAGVLSGSGEPTEKV